MTRNHSPGFSLVELMVVIMIIGVLATIGLSNYVAMADRAREGSVKNNAHSLRLGVEDYSITTGGFYPALADIGGQFFQGGVPPTNPFTGAVTVIAAPGFSRGDLGYVLVGGVYTIEGYGASATAGPAQDGIVITFHN